MPSRRALRRPAIERLLDDALRPGGSVRLVAMRGPWGSGRGTAVALWARRRIQEGTPVVWLDVAGAVNGTALGRRAVAGLAHLTGRAALASGSAEDVASALDGHEAVLVVDRLGRTSGPALSYLDRVARLLRTGRVVALTATPLPGTAPSFDGWPLDAGLGPGLDGGPGGGSWEGPADRATGDGHRLELTLRDLAVRPDEARAAAAQLGVTITDPQARTLVAATAGWPAVVYPALDDIARASAAGEQVTDALVAAVAAARRAACLRSALPEEAIKLLLEASIAERFRLGDLDDRGALSPADTRALVDRLLDTGVVLRDPASPDGILAVAPSVRRALLDYAHGREPEDLRRRAGRVARRREAEGDVRGALLVALEAGDADLVDGLQRRVWTNILDGQDATLHESLWTAVSSAAARGVPADLRALLSVTRRAPGRPGDGATAADAGGEQDGLATFVRAARLRRAGRAEESLTAAREWLRSAHGRPAVEQTLVGLQAAVSAAEAGQLHEALRYAENAYHAALAGGAFALAAAAAETAALVHALDSDVRAAVDWSAEAGNLPEPPGWWRHAIGDPPALVSALVRLERFEEDLPAPLHGAAREAGTTDLWFCGLHVEAVLAALRSQEDLAVGLLRDALAQRGRAPSEGDGDGDPRIPPLIALDLVRLYLSLGRGTNAALIADTVAPPSPVRALVDGRVLLARERPREALQAVAGVGALGETPMVGLRLESSLIAAEARGALDDADGARREFARAKALAQRAGGALPFWWVSAHALLSGVGDEHRPAGEPLDEVVRRRRTPVPVEFVVVPDRQLVVLHRLADGLTSTQVARESFVSHNTVKTQIREVYRRLGVHDRAAALQRAQELGLLDPIVRARFRGRAAR
ncbi:response regulator transcription factor [Myceligenerans sp. TRM 65318]|uniref:Response regulator transcription factor n=1 Tax=Myceligenerans pegani TaxID=2776917 RepID=A0ABR9N199_9MICO|nr:LuxR C-terminal-related transcriptional regulator [Myceligenerans sp. TRM 65318]MBE1877424.1 response regulator transcription factor [Myceligenerans sp. TRM 65318]